MLGLPSGPVVKNPPSNAGDTGSNQGSIPGWGTKIPHAKEQLSPRATTRGPTHSNEKSQCAQAEKPSHALTPSTTKKAILSFTPANRFFKSKCTV